MLRLILMVYGHATVVSFEQQYPTIKKPFIPLQGDHHVHLFIPQNVGRIKVLTNIMSAQSVILRHYESYLTHLE